jgi:hypothetical protein
VLGSKVVRLSNLGLHGVRGRVREGTIGVTLEDSVEAMYDMMV